MCLQKFPFREVFERCGKLFSKSFPRKNLPTTPTKTVKSIPQACGEANEEGPVVGLRFSVIGGAITADLAAFGAAMDDDVAVAVFGIGLGADGLHLTAAGIGAIAGVDVDVEGPEAEGAMIARGEAEGCDLFLAMRADESAIVFGKPFLFHERPPREKMIRYYGNTRDKKSQDFFGKAGLFVEMDKFNNENIYIINVDRRTNFLL